MCEPSPHWTRPTKEAASQLGILGIGYLFEFVPTTAAAWMEARAGSKTPFSIKPPCSARVLDYTAGQ